MAAIHVFDPALCCSSGVCGTEADRALVSFSADIDWLKQRDVA
ncbi:MAG TPA: arsenic metallochaperone ArsD family protein, partial [Nitrosomonas sp.]|nr:arsenic metallochaperone ArsD family protein [Nitrosomonas sp.]